VLPQPDPHEEPQLFRGRRFRPFHQSLAIHPVPKEVKLLQPPLPLALPRWRVLPALFEYGGGWLLYSGAELPAGGISGYTLVYSGLYGGGRSSSVGENIALYKIKATKAKNIMYPILLLESPVSEFIELYTQSGTVLL